MAVYTNLKRSHSKEPNQKLTDYHQLYQQSRSHIWPTNTHHTIKGNQKNPRAPQNHPRDNLVPSYGQILPKCGASHGFFIVNGIPFLHKKSREIYFRSVQAYNNRRKSETILGLNQVRIKYKDICFTITDYHGDNEFEHLHKFLAQSNLHTCAANEHIGDIEISIRTIKERVIFGCHSIPYKKSTKLMARYLVKDMITCLNMFSSKNCISSDLSQAAIILGYPNPDNNKLRITFGEYAQVYIGTTNST